METFSVNAAGVFLIYCQLTVGIPKGMETFKPLVAKMLGGHSQLTVGIPKGMETMFGGRVIPRAAGVS